MAKPTPSYMNSTASSTVRVCETRKMIAILQPMKVLVKIPWKSGITTPKIPTSAVTVKLTPSHHVPTATFAIKIKKPEVVVEKRMIATLHSPVIQGTMHSKSSHLMEKKKGSMLALKVNSSAISMEKSVLMASSIEQSTSSQISSGDDFHAIKKQSIDALVGMPSKTNVEKNPGNHEKKPEPPDDFSDYQGALEKLHALLDTNPIDLALSESAKKDQVIYELRSTCAELEQELAIHRVLNEIDRGKLESHTRIELEKLDFADEESKRKDAEISELKKICAQLRDELESLRVFSMRIFDKRMVESGQSLYYEESKRRSVHWESTQDGW